MTNEAVEPDFDVIVVGAGVAGCVTAYRLAEAGRSVVLIERGEAPGSKNLSGGVLYSRVMEEVFPDFLTQAPVERRITRNYVQFLNGTSSVGIDYQDSRLSDPVNAVTVLRARLDAWLGEKCEEAGVFLMPGSASTRSSPRTARSWASAPATTSCVPTWSWLPTASTPSWRAPQACAPRSRPTTWRWA